MNRRYQSVFYLVALSLGAVLSVSPRATAAQGDFDGFFKVTLSNIYGNSVIKQCRYRGEARGPVNRVEYTWNEIFEITTTNGKTVNIPFNDIGRDERTGRLHVTYDKNIAGFLDCPNDLLLIYNVLKEEFREAR